MPHSLKSQSAPLNWTYLFFAYGALLGFGLADNYRSPVYPRLLEDYQLSTSTGSWFFALSSLCALVINLTHGLWLPKLKAMGGLRFFLVVQCLGLGGLYFCLRWEWSFTWVLFMSGLFGASTGGLGICMNILVNKASNPLNRRRAFAGLHSMYGLASIIAPLFFHFLYTRNLAYSLGFIWITLIPVFLLICSFLKGNKRLQEEQKNWKLPHKEKLLFGLTIATYVASEILLSTRIPLFLEKAWSFTPEQANQYLLGFFICLFLGRFILSLKSWSFQNIPLLGLSACLSLIFMVLGILYWPVFLSLTGLTMSIYFPTAMDLVSQTYEEKSDSMIASILTTMGVFIIIIHYFFGLIVDWVGIEASMFMGVFLLTLTLTCLAVVRGKVKKIQSQ